MKNYEKRWNKIMCLISVKSSNINPNNNIFIKIKVNSVDDLPTTKGHKRLRLRDAAILTAFGAGGKIYLQVFLKECLCKL